MNSKRKLVNKEQKKMKKSEIKDFIIFKKQKESSKKKET